MGQIVSHNDRCAEIGQLLVKYKPQILAKLPSHIGIDMMMSVFMGEVRENPKIAECSTESLLACLLHASQMGLRVGGVTGEAYLIPRKKRCTLNVGYKGLEKLALQSERVTSIRPRSVYEGDTFELDEGSSPKLVHKRMLNNENRGKQDKLVGAYAVATFANGHTEFEFMDKLEIERIRKSAEYDIVWQAHYDEMCKKTVVRRLCKHLPSETELQRAIGLDERAEAGLVQPPPPGMEAFDLPEDPAPGLPAPEQQDPKTRKRRKKPETLDDVVPESETRAEKAPQDRTTPGPSGTSKQIISDFWRLDDDERSAVKNQFSIGVIGEVNGWAEEDRADLLTAIQDKLPAEAGHS